MALKDVANKIKSKVKAGVDYLTEPHYTEDQKKLNDLRRQVDTADKASIDAGSGKNNPEEWEKTRSLRKELWGDYNKQWDKIYDPSKYYDEVYGKEPTKPMKKGGSVKKYCRGGGIEVRGKTKGRMV